ncbi:hypothetical protein [Novosphingobium aquae]|uniref:Uncharacterized protein n=1 Tax=Novosphingobium aquae TaxID=3133435 RepID=A0ABU8S356_9SPHN
MDGLLAGLHGIQLGIDRGHDGVLILRVAGQRLGALAFIDRMAGAQRGKGVILARPPRTAALAQQEHDEPVVEMPPGAEQASGRDDRPLLPLDRARQQAIFQPGNPPINRRLPRRGKALGPRHLPQLIARLHAHPDRQPGLSDDACRSERRDKGTLQVRRDRIAPGLLVDIGGKAQQRIIRCGRFSGKGGAAGPPRRARGLAGKGRALGGGERERGGRNRGER